MKHSSVLTATITWMNRLKSRGDDVNVNICVERGIITKNLLNGD